MSDTPQEDAKLIKELFELVEFYTRQKTNVKLGLQPPGTGTGMATWAQRRRMYRC